MMMVIMMMICCGGEEDEMMHPAYIMLLLEYYIAELINVEGPLEKTIFVVVAVVRYFHVLMSSHKYRKKIHQ